MAGASGMTGTAGGAADGEALKVFMSYSRADQAAADALVAALEGAGFTVAIDRRDLPYGEEWQKELAALITESDTVLWLVSPDSVRSRWCRWELGEVTRLSKRLIPVRIRAVDPETLPAELGRIHLLPAEGVYDPALHEGALVAALRADRAWLKQATSLAGAARDWRANGRDRARLLRGAALAAAEAWSGRVPRGAPTPASEVRDFILASSLAQRRRQRYAVAGSAAVALVALALAGLAFFFQRQAEERTAVAVRNETISLGTLSRLALSEGRPQDAAKLGLAAWPRTSDPDRPMLRDVLDGLGATIAYLLPRRSFTPLAPRMMDAAFSPDGKLLAAAGIEGNVELIDVATATRVATIPPAPEQAGDPPPAASAVSFSPDSRRLAIGYSGAPAILFDLAGARTACSFAGMVLTSDLGFATDGKRLLVADDYGPTRLYDTATCAEVKAFAPAGGTFADFGPGEKPAGNEDRTLAAAIRYSRDGSRFLYVTWSPTRLVTEVHVFDAASLREVWSHDFAEQLFWFDLAPDGSRLVSIQRTTSRSFVPSSIDPDLAVIWDLATGGEAGRVRHGSGSLTYALFSPDGTRLATASTDGTIRIWSLSGAEPTPFGEPVPGFSGDGHVLQFSNDGRLLLSAAGDPSERRMRLIGMEAGNVVASLFAPDDGPYLARLSPDGRHVAAVSGLGEGATPRMALWDTVATSPPLVIAATESGRALAFSPDGSLLAAGGRGVEIRRVADGGAVARILDGPTLIDAVAWSPDGKRIAALSQDGAVYLSEDRAPAKPLPSLSGHARGIAFSRDGKLLLVGEEDGAVKVSDLATGARHPGPPPQEGGGAVAVSHDGARAAMATLDGVVVWNLADGTVVATAERVGAAVWSVDFSPDDRTIAAATIDGTVLVDAATGRQLGRLERSRGDTGAAIHAGSHFIATRQQGLARLWDLATNAPLLAIPSDGILQSIAVSPDGTRLAMGGNRIEIHDISSATRPSLPELACQRLGAETGFADLKARYGLADLAPICAGGPPAAVVPDRLQ